jgi:hypothetical protein
MTFSLRTRSTQDLVKAEQVQQMIHEHTLNNPNEQSFRDVSCDALGLFLVFQQPVNRCRN